MEFNRENAPRLRQATNLECATWKKDSASWRMLAIMAEFIGATERLSELHPAVSSFDSHGFGMLDELMKALTGKHVKSNQQ